MKFTPTCYGTPCAESVSGKWVARATRPCRSATRRPEERGGSLQKTHLHCLGARFPFRPASRRVVQASGPFYPKENFRTGSEIRVWPLRRFRSLGSFAASLIRVHRCSSVVR